MPLPPNPGAGAPGSVGNGDYTVRDGECIFSISDRAGHVWTTVWDHPRNQQLKSQRGSPHVLLPGDTVFIPAIQVKEVGRSVDMRHKFVRKGIPIDFELKILDGDEPRVGVRYCVDIEDRQQVGTIPESGIVTLKIRPSDRTGRLILRPGVDQEEYMLLFGHLDPAHAISGAKGRLRNIGFLASDDSDEAFCDALEGFQRRFSIPITGALDDLTARKLTEVHGS